MLTDKNIKSNMSSIAKYYKFSEQLNISSVYQFIIKVPLKTPEIGSQGLYVKISLSSFRENRSFMRESIFENFSIATHQCNVIYLLEMRRSFPYLLRCT